MMNRSEYTANMQLITAREESQAERNARVRARVAKIRAEKARRDGKKNWWKV